MKKFRYLLLLPLLIFIQADFPAYKLFTKEGKKAKFNDLIKDASKADIVFFGELHNNAISHWLQLELTKELHQKSGKEIILGAEMFESDQQLIMDEYLSGLISSRNFEEGTHLWNNYKTDYKPLVTFAKDNNLAFIASNIPRRYASYVAKKGLDSLKANTGKHAKMFIAPLPIEFDPELPGYKNMMHAGAMPGIPYLPQAQAIKDATMAHFIARNWKENSLFIHFNGAYHSKDFEGIVWYLKKLNPELNILTINTVEQENLDSVKEENVQSANYILVVDEDVTKTY
jgi:uncharacterized iron-regulated protein